MHGDGSGAETDARADNYRSVTYELFIVSITVLSLANTVIWLLFRDSNLAEIAVSLDLFLTGILFIDFLGRVKHASDRRHYLLYGYGWADFLGSLPFQLFPPLRFFRLLRLGTSFRRLNRLGARGTWEQAFGSRSGSSLALATLALLLVLEFGTMFVLRAEEDQPGATITTGQAAVWWGIGTVTTVGYGDYTPITDRGRFVAVLIMIAGIGLATVMTGYVANLFLRTTSHPSENAPFADDVATMRRTLEELKNSVAALEKTLQEREGEYPPGKGEKEKTR